MGAVKSRARRQPLFWLAWIFFATPVIFRYLVAGSGVEVVGLLEIFVLIYVPADLLMMGSVLVMRKRWDSDRPALAIASVMTPAMCFCGFVTIPGNGQEPGIMLILGMAFAVLSAICWLGAVTLMLLRRYRGSN